ncbi:MAG TPA: hypothetical protein VK980_13830 [Sphingomonas sp.]|nr:hypothetical protein [Sphingomonas sp.]
MRSILTALALLLGALLSGAAAPAPSRYAAGQVWEYHHRPQDAGSLLRIQKVEDGGKLGMIYHISVIGLALRNKTVGTAIPHTPVSQATLEASVTRLSSAAADWPDVEPGIAQWRQDEGGVFTITVAAIVQIIDDQTADAPAPPPTT